MEWCAVCTINGSLLWASSTYIVDYHFLRGTLSNIYGIVAASCIFPTLNYIPSSIKSISILYDGNEAAILTFPWKIKYKRLWKSKVDKITMIMTWQRRLATWSSSSFIIISDRQISLHNARRQKYMNFPKLWAHFRCTMVMFLSSCIRWWHLVEIVAMVMSSVLVDSIPTWLLGFQLKFYTAKTFSHIGRG